MIAVLALDVFGIERAPVATVTLRHEMERSARDA